MSVSSFPILPVLARFLHPLIFQSGLTSAHFSHTGHFLTLFQHHRHCENSFRLYSVHPCQSKWANSFDKVAVQVRVNICLPAHCPPTQDFSHFWHLAGSEKKLWNHLSNVSSKYNASKYCFCPLALTDEKHFFHGGSKNHAWVSRLIGQFCCSPAVTIASFSSLL